MFSFFKIFRSRQKPSLQISENAQLREFVGQTTRFVLEKAHHAASLEDVQVTSSGAAIIILKMAPQKPMSEDEAQALKNAIETDVTKITGITKVTIVMTTESPQSSESPVPPVSPAQTQASPTQKIPSVPYIIAVSSGKGGVGKSTVAINLALALARLGRHVGVLDADIYGPSIPRLAGVAQARLQTGDDDSGAADPGNPDSGKIPAIKAHGLKLMSIGFMVDETTPMIWRGPMVQSALLQMARDVDWSGLDILVLDMPPGTGDIHLTIAQKIPLSGAVVVSTPQDLALLDARKGLEMFKKVAVPILGIVENMSYFICPACGHREDIFGAQGARKEAEKLDVPFLGEVPLHAKIRELSDRGTPITVAEPDSPQALSFVKIAENILYFLDKGESMQKPAPKIVMED